MSTFIETCKKCGRKYKVEEYGVGASGGKERVDISCPYCGNIHEKRTAGGFRTFKLTPEEERFS